MIEFFDHRDIISLFIFKILLKEYFVNAENDNKRHGITKTG